MGYRVLKYYVRKSLIFQLSWVLYIIYRKNINKKTGQHKHQYVNQLKVFSKIISIKSTTSDLYKLLAIWYFRIIYFSITRSNLFHFKISSIGLCLISDASEHRQLQFRAPPPISWWVMAVAHRQLHRHLTSLYGVKGQHIILNYCIS
jgi:hypothetical protein